MNTPILSVKNLRKTFCSLNVLNGIDFEICKGDVISIIGPSGAGKTTLLRCMNFLESSDSGTMLFDGEEFNLATISKKDIARLHKKTAFVFQNFNLFSNKTVLKNVTEGLIAGRKMKKNDAEKIALEMLAKVGMQDKLGSYPHQLSGGQQQRVAIARALATEPEIIYFDEPTSALDPELIDEVLSLIQKLAEEGRTMLIVTHELNFAKNVSSKTIFMENGTILEMMDSKELFENPKLTRTKEFINRSKNNEK